MRQEKKIIELHDLVHSIIKGQCGHFCPDNVFSSTINDDEKKEVRDKYGDKYLVFIPGSGMYVKLKKLDDEYKSYKRLKKISNPEHSIFDYMKKASEI